MRFTILDSATRHGVTEEEIRAVVSYPMLRTRLAPRMPETVPYLFIGNFDDNEPCWRSSRIWSTRSSG